MKTDTSNEKLALLILAGIALVALAWIALRSLQAGTVDANAATVLGVIVGGLIAIAKDIIAAIRGYSMSAQLSKVTDQLAASGPAVDPPPVATEDAVQGAQQATDAAQEATDQLKEGTKP